MKKLQISLLLVLYVLLTGIYGCKKDPIAGNANVVAYTGQATSWSFDSPNYYTTFSIPDITSANINSIGVMVYFSTVQDNWVAVPYTQYHSPYDYHMGFITGIGKVKITWFYDSSLSDGIDPNAYYGTTVKYKIVLIPLADRKANPDLDLTDYEAVKKRFHLAD
jgi:hypothetical protein